MAYRPAFGFHLQLAFRSMSQVYGCHGSPPVCVELLWKTSRWRFCRSPEEFWGSFTSEGTRGEGSRPACPTEIVSPMSCFGKSSLSLLTRTCRTCTSRVLAQGERRIRSSQIPVFLPGPLAFILLKGIIKKPPKKQPTNQTKIKESNLIQNRQKLPETFLWLLPLACRRSISSLPVLRSRTEQWDWRGRWVFPSTLLQCWYWWWELVI